MAEKLNLNFITKKKIKLNFPAIGLKIFLAGFLEKFAFKIKRFYDSNILPILQFKNYKENILKNKNTAVVY